MTETLTEKISFQDQHLLVEAVENEERKHENDALDEGLKETFPASDPVAIGVTHIVVAKK